jgi:hypothetical protein
MVPSVSLKTGDEKSRHWIKTGNQNTCLVIPGGPAWTPCDKLHEAKVEPQHELLGNRGLQLGRHRWPRWGRKREMGNFCFQPIWAVRRATIGLDKCQTMFLTSYPRIRLMADRVRWISPWARPRSTMMAPEKSLDPWAMVRKGSWDSEGS